MTYLDKSLTCGENEFVLWAVPHGPDVTEVFVESEKFRATTKVPDLHRTICGREGGKERGGEGRERRREGGRSGEREEGKKGNCSDHYQCW